jgi:hypothetical protein
MFTLSPKLYNKKLWTYIRKDLTEELRELAGIAQEREKEEDVATLLKQFEEWKQTISNILTGKNYQRYPCIS